MTLLRGQEPSAAQKTMWDEIVAAANRFMAADRYLFAIPMWNGGIPYRLKQYIDVVHQAGLLWNLDAQRGYIGLLKNKHATLMLTSGAFDPGSTSSAFGVDHHSTYTRSWLNQAGVTEIDEVRFQPTLMTADPAGSLEIARRKAAELALKHGKL